MGTFEQLIGVSLLVLAAIYFVLFQRAKSYHWKITDWVAIAFCALLAVASILWVLDFD